MRETTIPNRGIAGLALAASLFLGCQDFLGLDKSGQSAGTPAEEAQVAAQGASTLGTSDQGKPDPVIADAVPAGDAPAAAAESCKPAASEPAATPAAGNAAECQAIYDQMLAAKEPLYGELKNKFGSLNCELSKVVAPTVPQVPPDSATVCKNLRSALEHMDPNSTKYASYQQDIKIYCADAKSPASPAATSPAPEPTSPVEACKILVGEMQGAKDPLYGELKDKYVLLNCGEVLVLAGPVTPPPPPPDSATVCSNLKSALATIPPDSPKYLMYQQEIATHCSGNP